ncbi:alpha amylase C-terminal domain-containing protein, partial [Acidobacteria bacterium AH-259-L09]|nr:alpha amylase C-terminal domain-containing protein [Acidobacteria bacterium AH-259-L09]
WRQMLNSDEKRYGGSGRVNLRVVETTPVSWHGRPHSLSLILPPLSALFLKSEGTAKLEVPLEEDQSREA